LGPAASSRDPYFGHPRARRRTPARCRLHAQAMPAANVLIAAEQVLVSTWVIGLISIPRMGDPCIKSSCRGTCDYFARRGAAFGERSPSSRISCRSSMGSSARTPDEPPCGISEARHRLHADGQTVARSREQGHVEPDGSEVASLRRNLRGPKPSGARSVPETSTAVPTWLGSALEAENNRPVAGLASRCARARGS
jgi:hypothetical protein